MATERALRHESYYREVGQSYDMRAPALAREWENPPMKLYRSAALQIYHSFLPRPSPGRREIDMLEYGAGIGRIAGHLFRDEPSLAGSLLPVRLTAVDLSSDSLKIYKKSVVAPFLEVTPVTGNIVQILEDLPKTKVFDTIFSNGAYQIPPDDMSYIIQQSMLHLKEGGAMFFDFLPSEGKKQREVYSEKSPRGNYDTYHYPVETIRRFILGATRETSGGYSFRFIRLSELKNEKTGHLYGPLTVADIEKGSGEKQVDPIFCVIRRSLISPELQEELEKTYTDILEKTGDFFGVRLPVLPIKFGGAPTGYVNDAEKKERYISINPATGTIAVRRQLQVALTEYAVDRMTGKKLPAALSGGGLALVEDPFVLLRRYLDSSTGGLEQAVKLLDIRRLMAAPESVDGADVSVPGNALLEYIRRSKGNEVLKSMLLAGISDKENLYGNRADNFFAQAARYYGSVAEFQKGFLHMVLGEAGVAAYEDIRHPVRSTLKKIAGFAKAFLRRLFS